MATFIVTRVRKELSEDGTHRHIEGVCTDTGDHYTRREVVDSIDKGNILPSGSVLCDAVHRNQPQQPQAGQP